MALMLTPECKALRHAFFAERAASKIPDVPEDTPVRDDQVGGRDRRRHDGRRHRDELPQRRHPGDDARDEAGRARPRPGDDPQELRVAGQEGQAQGRTSTSSAWRCCKPTLSYDDLKDADLVIEAVFEEMGVKETVFKKLDAGDEARRDPGEQHLDARRRQDRGVHQAPAGRGRHALLQPGQRDEAARGGARRQDRPRTCWPP